MNLIIQELQFVYHIDHTLFDVGGSLGDNASPLGETAIISSTIVEVPLMKHVKTILPYSIVSIAISAILFILFAFI